MPGGGVVFLHAQQPVADLLDSLDGDERTGARIITGRWRSLSDRLPRTLGPTAPSWWIRYAPRAATWASTP